MSEEKKKELPAIQVSIAVGLQDNHQMQIAWYLDPASTKAEQNAALDLLGELADRQKAKYEIVGLKKQRDELAAASIQADADLADVDAAADKQRAEMLVKRSAMQKKLDDNQKEGFEEHVKAGFKGQYVMAGARKQTANATAAAMDQLDKEIERIEADRIANRGNAVRTIEAQKRKIKWFEEQIAEREKLL